jgi:glutaminase
LQRLVIKPFLLLHLLEKLGPDVVFKRVGKRPSDQPFYSNEQLVADGFRPRNPMLNSGAMLLSTYLEGATPREQGTVFLDWLNAHAGTDFKVHEPTLDEMLTGEDGENTRLSKLLERAGHVDNARAAFEIYFHVCCIAGTVTDLARLGLLLAMPKAELSPQHQSTVTALTLTCGLYEASAEWAVDVGVPCKSGVSGCIVGIVPGQGSLATFTPWLDAGGNPMAGMTMLRAMAQDMSLGLFHC